MHQIGDIYRHGDGAETLKFMLCLIGKNKCCLVDVDNGNRWIDAVSVSAFQGAVRTHISDADFDKVIGPEHTGTFERTRRV